MIREFTDRRPTASAVLLFVLFFVVPGLFLLIMSLLLPESGDGIAISVISVYAFVLEFILLVSVERPALIGQPFIMALLGFIIAEIVYTVSESANPIGAGPGAIAFLVSNAVITILGSEVGSILAALPAYWLFLAVRKLVNHIRYRRA